jgi:hypothetical protein
MDPELLTLYECLTRRLSRFGLRTLLAYVETIWTSLWLDLDKVTRRSRALEAQLREAQANLALLQAQMELPAPLTNDERQGKGFQAVGLISDPDLQFRPPSCGSKARAAKQGDITLT